MVSLISAHDLEAGRHSQICTTSRTGQKLHSLIMFTGCHPGVTSVAGGE